MNVTLHNIKVRDLFEGFKEDFSTDQVAGYGGRLDIRPKFQRAFVYKDAQRNEVIETVLKGFPLNVMYWSVKPDGASYEVIDGQQRTISICQYLQGDFSVGGKYFCNQPSDIRRSIEDYELTVYFCEGTESEKLDWFRVINIAGERLEEQELRNASYVGPWVVDAKRYFSSVNGMAYLKWKDYMAGECIRQKWLETVIGWIAGDDSDGSIKDYMGRHQNEPDATELKVYFESVMSWALLLFPRYRKEMKGVEWGFLYNRFKDGKYSAASLEKRVAELMADDEVGRRSGIYEYVLSGESPECEKCLSLRTFTPNQKRAAYERQGGKCALCGKQCDISAMQGDHVIPWSIGGKTVPDNLQMLCARCNLSKGAKG